MTKRILRWLKKWFFCRWFHDRDRCFPTVWSEETAIREGNLPYRPNYWHCSKCHPCDEEFFKKIGLFQESP